MSGFYKIIGAGIGWMLTKSLYGVIIGFGIGWMVDSLTKKGKTKGLSKSEWSSKSTIQTILPKNGWLTSTKNES